MNGSISAGGLDQEMASLLDAIQVTSATGFMFNGQTVAVGSEVASIDASGLALHPLVSQLRDVIYQHAYTRRFSGRATQDIHAIQDLAARPFVTDQGFVTLLSEANVSRERWDLGWRVIESFGAGQLLAQKSGHSRIFWPGQFINVNGAGPSSRPGDLISAYCPRESHTIQPGFYFAFGETLADHQDDGWLTRFYWNVRAEGAPGLIGLLTSTMNSFQVPFRFKCPETPWAYGRIDSAVLYVPRRMTQSVAAMLVKVHSGCAAFLDADTPLFTERLGPGLAFAEDPGNGESFGSNRSRLIAEAIWQAYVNDSQTQAARLQTIRSVFAREGLDYERPYLGAGAHEDYLFPAFL